MPVDNVSSISPNVPVERNVKSPAPIAEQAPVIASKDKINLTTQQGKAETEINLVQYPNWTDKTKTSIINSFNYGLKVNNITVEELNSKLKDLGMGEIEWNIDKVKDTHYAPYAEEIQKKLNNQMNNKELKELNLNHRINEDGRFGKNTISAIVALHEALPINRGAEASFKVQPLKQVTKTGCYRTAEAMFFNYIHSKEEDELYTELDARERIKWDERNNDWHSVNITAENSDGRIELFKGKEFLAGIDKELDKGHPVIAGVSYFQQEEKYNEGITDHFVLITGRKYDESGVKYIFNDPADSEEHYFRMDPYTGKLSATGARVGVYDVTGFNTYNLESEVIEKYKKLGKPLYYPGDKSKEIKIIQQKLINLGFDTNGTEGKYGSGTKGAVIAFQKKYELPVTGIIDTKMLKRINELSEK